MTGLSSIVTTTFWTRRMDPSLIFPMHSRTIMSVNHRPHPHVGLLVPQTIKSDQCSLKMLTDGLRSVAKEVREKEKVRAGRTHMTGILFDKNIWALILVKFSACQSFDAKLSKHKKQKQASEPPH